MKALELPQVSSVQGPRFAAIEQTSEHHSSVHLEFSGHLDVVLIQDARSELTKCLACLANSGMNFFVQTAIITDAAAKVFEFLHGF